MSKMAECEIICPECNTKQKITYWESINVDVDEELKKELMEGNINVIKCSNCDFSTFLEYPLFYHDMTKQYCVQYYPSEMLYNPISYVNIFSGMTKDGKKVIPSNWPIDPERLGSSYILEPHIVFDIEEMKRYVLFREYLWHIHEQK